jgi:hypothetical protein
MLKNYFFVCLLVCPFLVFAVAPNHQLIAERGKEHFTYRIGSSLKITSVDSAGHKSSFTGYLSKVDDEGVWMSSFNKHAAIQQTFIPAKNIIAIREASRKNKKTALIIMASSIVAMGIVASALANAPNPALLILAIIPFVLLWEVAGIVLGVNILTDLLSIKTKKGGWSFSIK